MADGDPRGLLWVLDEEMVTPASSENNALERVCQYYSGTGKNTHTHTHAQCVSSLKCSGRVGCSLLCVPAVRQCEQPLQCEVNHLMGGDPVRYDLTGWFGLIQNNLSSLNAISLLQNSTM